MAEYGLFGQVGVEWHLDTLDRLYAGVWFVRRALDIRPALKDRDSHYWRAMSGTGT